MEKSGTYVWGGDTRLWLQSVMFFAAVGVKSTSWNAPQAAIMGVTQYWCNVWATQLLMHRVKLRNGSRYPFNCVYGMYGVCSASVSTPLCFCSANFSCVYDTDQDERSSEAPFPKLTLSVSASWFPSGTRPPPPRWHTTQNKDLCSHIETLQWRPVRLPLPPFVTISKDTLSSPCLWSGGRNDL